MNERYADSLETEALARQCLHAYEVEISYCDGERKVYFDVEAYDQEDAKEKALEILSAEISPEEWDSTTEATGVYRIDMED